MAKKPPAPKARNQREPRPPTQESPTHSEKEAQTKRELARDMTGYSHLGLQHGYLAKAGLRPPTPRAKKEPDE